MVYGFRILVFIYTSRKNGVAVYGKWSHIFKAYIRGVMWTNNLVHGRRGLARLGQAWRGKAWPGKAWDFIKIKGVEKWQAKQKKKK